MKLDDIKIDSEIRDDFFTRIRRAEIKNDKTNQFDDKQMIQRITNYLVEQAKKGGYGTK